MYVRPVLNIFMFCVFITKVQSKCEKTYTNECEKVSDVERYGQKSWTNLVISPNMCKKTTSHTLDEVLKPNAFVKTPNIEELIIVEKIDKIQAGALNGIKRLVHLKFYKNQLVVIPRDAFANLIIHKLDLKRNSIENIEHELFRQSRVTIINLSYNKLNNIQINMLNIPSLETLIITNNHLQSLVEGCFHENLEYLNLEFNSLSQITEGVLKPLKNLKELNLSHNRFKGIELSYGLPSLESLDLSHNEIVVIVEDSFKNFWELKSLKLDHNYLTAISYKIFPTGNSITTLHLHYNAFMYIPETTAQILPKLREITIGGNPWACPCLVIVTGYLQEKNITQPECDRKYFSIGRSAVCVITDDESCTYEEKLTQVDFNNFRSSLQQDLCFEL